MRLRSNRDTNELPIIQLSRGSSGCSAQHRSHHPTSRKSGGQGRRKMMTNDDQNGTPSKKKKKSAQMKDSINPTASGSVSNIQSESCSKDEVLTSSGTGDIVGDNFASGMDFKVVRHINSLPQHILISVMTKLPILDRIRIERVCRLWRRIAKNFAWTGTTTFSYSSLMCDKICTLPSMIERPIVGNAEIKSLAIRSGIHLREMDLHAFRDTLTYSVCMNFVTYCPKLTVLNMYGIQLTNSSLQLLGRHCPLLEVVNFHRCFQESVVERGLSSFFSKCTHLKELDVGDNERLTGLPSFTLLSNSIKTLKIGGCYRLAPSSLQAIKERCPDLLSLTMNNIDNISPTELNAFFASLCKLEKLKFGEYFLNHALTRVEVNFSSLKNLTELTVNDNLLISDQVLRTTVSGCKQLKYVDLSGCNRFVTNDGLLELTKLPHLTHLNLSMIKFVKDIIVKKISERGILQTVLLHYCEEITDDSITELLKNCPNLIAIDVSFCPKISNVSMERMINYVKERKEREAVLPKSCRAKATPLSDVVTQMLRHERSLQSLIDADFERQLMRFENFRYRFEQSTDYSDSPWVDLRRFDRFKSNTDGFTELHVWIGHSGISASNRLIHPLLRVDDTESLAEQPSSVYEFSVIIRIN